MSQKQQNQINWDNLVKIQVQLSNRPDEKFLTPLEAARINTLIAQMADKSKELQGFSILSDNRAKSKTIIDKLKKNL